MRHQSNLDKYSCGFEECIWLIKYVHIWDTYGLLEVCCFQMFDGHYISDKEYHIYLEFKKQLAQLEKTFEREREDTMKQLVKKQSEIFRTFQYGGHPHNPANKVGQIIQNKHRGVSPQY